MGTASKSKEQHGIPPDAAVAGVLALLIDAREARVKGDKEAVKTEPLLFNAGLSIGDIAALMGKKYDTVKTTLQRSRGK